MTRRLVAVSNPAALSRVAGYTHNAATGNRLPMDIDYYGEYLTDRLKNLAELIIRLRLPAVATQYNIQFRTLLDTVEAYCKYHRRGRPLYLHPLIREAAERLGIGMTPPEKPGDPRYDLLEPMKIEAGGIAELVG